MITKSTIESIIACVPEKYQKKLLPFFGYSLGNVFLDLLSVAYLLPFLMLSLDHNSTFGNKYFQFLFQKDHLIFSILSLIAFFIIKNTISILFINYQNRLIFAISSEISKKYTDSFIHNNYLFYQNQDKGEIIKNTIEVPNNFANNVLLSLNTLISEGIVISVISVIGLMLFPKISVFAILLFTLAFLIIYTFKKVKKVNKSLSLDYKDNINSLLDLINGFFEIKTAAKEKAFLDKFNSSNERLNKTYAFLTTIKNSNSKYLEIIIIIIISLLVCYLVNYSHEETKNVLLISFIASVFFKLIPSLNKLTIANSSIKSYDYTIDSILKNDISESEISTGETKISFEDTLKIEDISFRYTSENNLIDKVSLNIEKGKIIGICGRSGAGKTTLLRIFLKLIEPESGRIVLDGKEITQSNKNAFLALFGYVTQEPYIFNATILENIAIGQAASEIDFDRINMLINAIGFEEVIHNLEGGIHAFTGNGGQKLSGGQKQKLSIVRALYCNPEILILDEATNQLDEENESKILNYIKQVSLKQNLTVILISHDKTVLTHCESIYQFQKGTLHEV